VVRVERPDHPRLTLTLPVLSAAPVAIFLVEGESKREALRLLLTGADIPAALVAAERVVILADPAAAP
jgi:6-phosphogluconolactonase/glucosamine-6-phosphate isomerase/deaminase